MVSRMGLDLLAGTGGAASPIHLAPARAPRIMVMDSGLGGLTVFDEITRQIPAAELIYLADNAGFPYGRLSNDMLVRRVSDVMKVAIAAHAPDIVVIACNTASTLALPVLRSEHGLPFVGTVPAVKPAAALSRSRRIAVLATPGTVARDYTHELISRYATSCRVALVGSPRLAGYAEAELAGDPASDAELVQEIAPCFVADEGGATDVVVLACTHYPLLLHRFEQLAPWAVTWINPAAAIARRVASLITVPAVSAGNMVTPLPRAIYTQKSDDDRRMLSALSAKGLVSVEVENIPFEE
jgi:glutamate racemase